MSYFLLSWGSGATGVLMHGSPSDCAVPVRCFGIPQQISDCLIAPGGSHCFLALASGEDYRTIAVGGNDTGQLGDPKIDAEFGGPVMLQFSSKIAHCASGWNHTVVSTENGQLFAWGEAVHGQCGISGKAHPKLLMPMHIDLPILQNRRIKQVACGMRHSALLLDSGEVFTFGEGRHGQLGTNTESANHTPRKVHFPESASQVTSIALGARHSVFVTASGQVFSTGCNRYGQCGLGQTTSKVALPTPVVLEQKNAVRVSCGWNFTLILLEDRKNIMGFGRNNYGQLGCGTSNAIEYSTKQVLVPLGTGETVQDIASGSEHSLILTSDSSVFAFGWNEHGQLGLGDSQCRLTPERVNVPPTRQIFVGGGFSMVLATQELHKG